MLIVESPGSIAELGAFSQKDILSNKLIAILESSLIDGPSFIRDGPVESLGGVDGDAVLLLTWLGEPDECRMRPIDRDLANEAVSEVGKEISEALRSSRGEERFRGAEIGHQLLLIADFVSLANIVKQEEIAQFLAGLGICLLPKDLNRFLFLLRQLKVIETQPYNRKNYYVKGPVGGEFVRYSFKDKDITPDRIRLESDLGEIFAPAGKKPIDRNRDQAWRAYHRRRGDG